MQYLDFSEDASPTTVHETIRPKEAHTCIYCKRESRLCNMGLKCSDRWKLGDMTFCRLP